MAQILMFPTERLAKAPSRSPAAVLTSPGHNDSFLPPAMGDRLFDAFDPHTHERQYDIASIQHPVYSATPIYTVETIQRQQANIAKQIEAELKILLEKRLEKENAHIKAKAYRERIDKQQKNDILIARFFSGLIGTVMCFILGSCVGDYEILSSMVGQYEIYIGILAYVLPLACAWYLVDMTIKLLSFAAGFSNIGAHNGIK